MSWDRVELQEVARQERGSIVSGPFGSNISAKFFVDDGVPVIRGNNLTKGAEKFIDDGFAFLTETKAAEFPNCIAIEGDIVFTAAGSIGQVGIIPPGARYERYVISNKQLRVRLDRSKVDPRFVYAWLSSPQMVRYLENMNNGGAVPLLNLGIIRKVPVPFPPMATQVRIADILTTYDELIENNRRRMALLEEAARQLYREWFVCLRFPGHEHTHITDGVPDGWQRTTFGDLCDAVREVVKPDALEPDTPYIGLEHIPRRSIALSEWGAAEQVTSSKHRFAAGDVIFGKIRPYFHKVGIAFVDGVASSDAIVIRSHNPDHLAFVLMTASSDPFVAATAQTMREGSKMPRADWKQMQAYPSPLPPAGLLGSFEVTIDSIVEQLKTLSFANQKLRAARDLLLPRLMSGEIAV